MTRRQISFIGTVIVSTLLWWPIMILIDALVGGRG